MSSDLSLALQVTLVGMSLVFAAIVLLWWLMALLVRALPEAEAEPPGAEARRAALRQRAEAVMAGDEAQRVTLRRRAAAAAVAALLGPGAAESARSAAPPATATVSPWQAAMRASRLRQRGPTR
jgi:Na+-transporting methylmalonyl-CoA/oxaloacetate decarboxylase gamma subunit